MKIFKHKKQIDNTFDIVHLSGPKDNYDITESMGTLIYTGKDNKNKYELANIDKFCWAKGETLSSIWSIEYSKFASSLKKIDIFGDGSCKATYNFDGDVNDLSGYYNCTAYNISYTTGKFNQALNLSGNSYVSLQNIYTYFTKNKPFTVSLWFKTNTNLGSTNFILSFGDWLDGGFRFTPDHIQIGTNGTNTNIPLMRNNTLLGAWNHMVICFSNNTLTVYMNNVLIKTVNNINYEILVDRMYLGIAYNGGLEYAFTGQIDQFRIFDRALTADEVTILYNEK